VQVHRSLGYDRSERRRSVRRSRKTHSRLATTPRLAATARRQPPAPSSPARSTKQTYATHSVNRAQSEYKRALANVSRSRYVAIATQPVHRLQIRPIVHNEGAFPTTPPSYIRVRAIVWACGADRQTDRHKDARDHNTFRVVYDLREI